MTVVSVAMSLYHLQYLEHLLLNLDISDTILYCMFDVYVFLELRFKSEAGLDESSISSDEPLLSPIAPRAPSTKPGSQGTSKSTFKLHV